MLFSWEIAGPWSKNETALTAHEPLVEFVMKLLSNVL